MGLQLFGTRKSPDTRKAERYLKERGIGFQFIDLADKGISPGELRSVARASGGYARLVDEEGALFKAKGLGYMEFDPEEELLKEPLLLKSPVLRDGSRAAVGFDEATWKAMLSDSRRHAPRSVVNWAHHENRDTPCELGHCRNAFARPRRLRSVGRQTEDRRRLV